MINIEHIGSDPKYFTKLKISGSPLTRRGAQFSHKIKSRQSDVNTIQDLRKVNYSMEHAKNLIMNKKSINQSLEFARKKIFFMAKVKSKNQMIKSKLENNLIKDVKKRERYENRAIVRDLSKSKPKIAKKIIVNPKRPFTGI